MTENFPERGNHQDRRESLLECITSWFSETFTTLLQIPNLLSFHLNVSVYIKTFVPVKILVAVEPENITYLLKFNNISH